MYYGYCVFVMRKGKNKYYLKFHYFVSEKNNKNNDKDDDRNVFIIVLFLDQEEFINCTSCSKPYILS